MRPVLVLALALMGCGDTSLQLKGAMNRVVGETVTLALTGGPTFTGDLSLRSPDGTTLAAAALQASKKDERTLSFMIPAGIAAGRALALAGRTGGGNYEIPLQVNRLALTLDDKGTLEGWPLAPGTLSRLSIPTGDIARPMMSLAPTGGELALWAADQVRLLSLGPEIKDVGAGIKQGGVTVLAGVSGNRVLFATSDALNLVRFTKGQQTTQETIALKDVRAVATTSGDTALTLSACDKVACLEQVSLAPSFSRVTGSQVQLEAGPAANLLGATHDGKGAVVVEGSGIYGIYFDGSTSGRKTKLEWRSESVVFTGQPIGVDRVWPVVVSGQTVDLFVVGEASKNQVLVLAFDANNAFDLRVIASVVVTDSPKVLSYGRGTLLYFASANKLFSLNAGEPKPSVVPIAEVTPANPIVNLVVQR